MMKHVAKRFKTIKIPNPYNIGTVDRALRFVLGGVLVGSIFYLDPSLSLSVLGAEIALYKLLPLLGIYPAVTAWLGWDPIYHITHIKSDTELESDVCGSIVSQTKAVVSS
jgi:hypothetical protein